MKKFKENWRKLLWYEKVLHIIGFFAAIGAIVFPLLDLLGVCDSAPMVYIPLLAVLMLIQAFENRSRSRKLMIFSLCSGIFIAICWIAVLCIR